MFKTMLENLLDMYWFPYYYTYKSDVIAMLNKIAYFSNRYIYPFYIAFAAIAGLTFSTHLTIAIISLVLGIVVILINAYTRNRPWTVEQSDEVWCEHGVDLENELTEQLSKESKNNP